MEEKKKRMGSGRKTRGEGWGGGGEDVREEEDGRHHFFWGVESFCIPRILLSSSETKSYRETGGTKHMKKILHKCGCCRVKRKKKGIYLTSVGLKQSTSKSCKNNRKLYEMLLCAVACRHASANGCIFITYLHPGCPLNITGHIQQFIHIYLKLRNGLLL